MLTNAKARRGDLLVLTKPIGTGIATTGIKRGLTSRMLERKIIKLMCKVNSVGAKLAERDLVRAATDITGFGLIGHLASMCRASGVSAKVESKLVPVIDREIVDLMRRGCVPGGTRGNLKSSRGTVDWQETPETYRILLSDAQTSGGLLLAVAPARLKAVLALLKRDRSACASVIGEITSPQKRLICINA
jgi:selenide,water dikinase